MGAGGDVHIGLDLGQALDVGVDGPVSLMGAGGDVHVGLNLGQVLVLLVLALQGVHGRGGWCFTSLLRSCSESASCL